MLRINVPYGCLNSVQMRKLAHIARVYDKDYGHLTTRQNMQFNWIKLADMPEILLELASVEMHGIQSSGNCIRNITADEYAGVAAEEVEDPRVYCELLRQWSSLHPEFSFLPRKFKIAVTGSEKDRAAVKAHDIGLRLHEKDGVAGAEVVGMMKQMFNDSDGMQCWAAKTKARCLAKPECTWWDEKNVCKQNG